MTSASMSSLCRQYRTFSEVGGPLDRTTTRLGLFARLRLMLEAVL